MPGLMVPIRVNTSPTQALCSSTDACLSLTGLAFKTGEAMRAEISKPKWRRSICPPEEQVYMSTEPSGQT
jgi:hypothetical protein